jgi:hypothetical protein
MALVAAASTAGGVGKGQGERLVYVFCALFRASRKRVSGGTSYRPAPVNYDASGALEVWACLFSHASGAVLPEGK